MKFASFDAYDVHPARLFVLSVGITLGSGAALWTALGEAIGAATPAVIAGISVLVGYIVLTTPGRLLSATRVAQSKEAPLLSLSAAACMEVTGSKSRTLLVLRGRSRSVESALFDMRRRVLLGREAGRVVELGTKKIVSQSLTAALESAVTTGPARADFGGVEATGYSTASEAADETRLPVFLSVCFFTPILLILYSVFSRAFDPRVLTELVVLEFVAVDVAFFVTTSEGVTR
ncbi:MAG TPA: hypothetical protein VFE91_01105 [Nitrososphaerales archaeon]|nr:hypothetical protein [Nitrososphaerales archaeon]